MSLIEYVPETPDLPQKKDLNYNRRFGTGNAALGTDKLVINVQKVSEIELDVTLPQGSLADAQSYDKVYRNVVDLMVY